MEIEIRRAEEKDLDFIVSLWQKCYSLPWSEALIKKEISLEDSAFFVAESGGAPVGYALMKDAVDAGELCNIAVDASSRRCGAGRALVRAVADEAKRRGYGAVYLEVRASNAAAISLYEDVGFVLVGNRKNYYRAPREDALLYNYYF